jgi:hypothetical protein
VHGVRQPLRAGSALADITTGPPNGICPRECVAGPGYDFVTGLSSPRAAIDAAPRRPGPPGVRSGHDGSLRPGRLAGASRSGNYRVTGCAAGAGGQRSGAGQLGHRRPGRAGAGAAGSAPWRLPRWRPPLDDQFQGMPAEGVGWAAAEATARRSGGGLPALVVEVAAGGQASGSTSGCVNRTGLPSDRA